MCASYDDQGRTERVLSTTTAVSPVRVTRQSEEVATVGVRDRQGSPFRAANPDRAQLVDAPTTS